MSQPDINVTLAATLTELVRGLNEGVSTFQTNVNKLSSIAKSGSDDITQSFDRIGGRSLRDINQEITAVEQSYKSLAASGQLSARDQARAFSLTQARIAELRREGSLLGPALRQSRAALTGFVAAGAGLAAFLGNAANTAAQFSEAMNEVSTLLPDDADINSLAESVRGLSREFGQDNVTQARALYQVISAGATEGAEATRILEQANKLAIGGITDVKTAVDALQPALNAYGRGAESAAEFSDVLFQTVRDGRTTIPELAAALGQVTPLANNAGISFQELGAGVATLTKSGASTSQAVTQLRGIISAIIKPTAEARNEAERLGLSFNTAALQSQGLGGFLQELAEKTGGSQDSLAKLFGQVEGLGGVLTLTGAGADDLAASLASMANAAGATDEAFEKIKDSPAQQIREFRSAVQDLNTSFGEAVTSLTPLLVSLTDLVNRFNELPAETRTTAAEMTALAATLGTVLLGVRALTPVFKTLLTSIGLLGGAGAGVTTLGAAFEAAGGKAKFFGNILRRLPLVAVVAALGKLIIEYRAAAAAQQELDDITAETVIAQAELAAKVRATVAANREFKDTVVLTAEQLRQLNQGELTEYQEKLQGAIRLWQALLVSNRQIGNEDGVARARAKLDEYNQALSITSDTLGQIAADLKRMNEAADDAADGIRLTAKEVEKAFDDIGISAGEAASGIDDSTASSIRALNRLVDAGALAGDALTRAFRQVAASVDTPQEVAALTEQVRALFDEGRLTTDQYKEFTATLDELADKAEAAEAALTRTGDAASNSGEKAANAGKRAADGTNEAAQATQQAVSQTGAAIDQLESNGGALAKVIGDALDGVRVLSDGASEAVDDLIARLNQRIGGDPSSFLRRLGEQLGNIRTEFERQTEAADQAIADYERTGRAVTSLTEAIQLTTANVQLLDQQRLDRLTSIIQQARAEQERFNSSAQDGLAQLQEELLALTGNEEQLARLRRERRRKDIELELIQARRAGAGEAVRALEEQLRLLDRIQKIEGSGGNSGGGFNTQFQQQVDAENEYRLNENQRRLDQELEQERRAATARLAIRRQEAQQITDTLNSAFDAVTQDPVVIRNLQNAISSISSAGFRA